MFEKILVAIDGSEGSKKALSSAIAIAKRFRAELYSISVKERPSHYAATVGEVMEDQEEIDRLFLLRLRKRLWIVPRGKV